jgi:hypothetical protein
MASDALLKTLHPLIKNVLQTVDHFEISCFGVPFVWLEKPRNRMGRDLGCMADVLMGFHRSTFSKPKFANGPRILTRRIVILQVEIFWVVVPCIVIVGYHRFRHPCCLHFTRCHNPEDLEISPP